MIIECQFLCDYEKYDKFNCKLIRTTIFGQKALHFSFYQKIYHFCIFLNYFMLKSMKFHSENSMLSWYFGYLCLQNVRRSYVYSWNYVLFRARIVLFKLPKNGQFWSYGPHMKIMLKNFSTAYHWVSIFVSLQKIW